MGEVSTDELRLDAHAEPLEAVAPAMSWHQTALYVCIEDNTPGWHCQIVRVLTALSLMTLLLGAAVEFTGKLSALTVEGRYQARKIQLLVAAQVVAERETQDARGVPGAKSVYSSALLPPAGYARQK